MSLVTIVLLLIGGAVSIWGSVWAGLPLFLAGALFEAFWVWISQRFDEGDEIDGLHLQELEKKLEEQRAEMKKLQDKMNSLGLAVGLKTINPA